jgi:hypothetical protein
MLNLKILTILLLLGVRVTSWAVEFEQVIKNPSKFHNKRVTLVAMVEGGAVERFYLYQPPEPKVPKDDAREIYGIISTESPPEAGIRITQKAFSYRRHRKRPTTSL